jgi:aspartyl-tRNA(Asn)/glutamyl-tRNA(Gln) amidotransferase subunit A
MDSIFFYRSPETVAPPGGYLQGLKIAIQPNISVAGWPTTACSNALVNFTALEDATIVQRLRQAGAFLYGSTFMSEFGFGLQNSKAGEAIRQQATDVELILDFMGESRIAASHVAVFGFKPSYGLVSRFGLIGLIPSMECCGVLSGNLKNIRDIMKTITGQDELDFSLPDEKTLDYSPQKIDPQETTIGIIKEAQSALTKNQENMFHASVNELKKYGFSVLEISMPDFSLFSLVHQIIGSVEASSTAGRYDSVRYGQRTPGAKNWNDMYILSRGAAFGPLLKSYLFQGAFFQFERYDAFENACRIRARLVEDMQRLISQVDFLLLPLLNDMTSNIPTSLADMYTQFASTTFANVTGQPVLYLPLASDMAYSGFQLVGPRLSDARLLALGEQLLNVCQGGQ